MRSDVGMDSAVQNHCTTIAAESMLKEWRLLDPSFLNFLGLRKMQSLAHNSSAADIFLKTLKILIKI